MGFYSLSFSIIKSMFLELYDDEVPQSETCHFKGNCLGKDQMPFITVEI